VVVVVTGAGTVVCCVVVVSLWLGLSVLQPVIERRPAAAMHERMIFFIFSLYCLVGLFTATSLPAGW
jgi:LytS/YehU family sensor histidine kinase